MFLKTCIFYFEEGKNIKKRSHLESAPMCLTPLIKGADKSYKNKAYNKEINVNSLISQ